MILSIAFLALAGQATALPTLPPADKVVLTVNGHEVKAVDVEALAYDWFGSQVVQALTYSELFNQEAAKRGIKLTDAEVNAKIDEQLKQVPGAGADRKAALAAMKQRGVTLSKLTLGVKLQLLLEKMVLADFKPDLFVRVATIVIRPKSPSTDDLKTALTAADNASQELTKGQTWDQVLAKYATDKQAAANHGELGWVPLSALPPTTQAELAKLKLNGFTKPAQTSNGIQIFKLEALGKDAPPTELDQLKGTYLPTAERTLVDKLQKEAKIVSDFTP